MTIQAAYIGVDRATSETITDLMRQHYRDVLLVAIIDNPEDNLDLVNHLNLDLVLMDIDLPENKEGDLMHIVPEKFASKTIIISRNESKAVTAMHKGMLDFLPKPIELSALKETLKHFKNHSEHEHPNTNIVNFDRIIVNRHDKAYLLELDNIHYFDADGPYTTIMTTGGRKISSSKALGYYRDLLEEKKNFVLLNRSTIMNIQNIKEILKDEGEGIVVMKDGIKIDISRLSKNRLLQILQELQGNNL